MSNQQIISKIIYFILSIFSYQLAFSQINHQPKNLLIKWSAQRSTIQQENLTKLLAVNQITKLNNSGVELWSLPSTSNIADLVERYKNYPGIEIIEPDYFYTVNIAPPNDPNFNNLWALHNTGQKGGQSNADINALAGWDIINASPSIGVAIFDSGIDWQHEDLGDNIWQNMGEDIDKDGRVLEWDGSKLIFDPDDENGIDDDGNGYVDDFVGWDFQDNDNNPNDEHGHGTNVAGIVGAKGNNNLGIVGVTWQVQMAAIKFTGPNGRGKTSDAIRALDYIKKMGFPISNLSWGGSNYSRILYDALQNSNEKEQLFIIAAGNSGLNNDHVATYPASYQLDNIIAVAAINNNNQLSSYSNYGLKSVDIVAPGIDILSTNLNNTYTSQSGTSLAAPHVTGACALLWEYAPNKNSFTIKQDLLSTVDPIPNLENQILSGGRLNLKQLLEGPNCRLNDSLALVALYHSTNGADWFNTWDLSQPFSYWYGVTTNYGGCVTALNLSNNNLVGALSDEIGSLGQLHYLDLSNNSISGIIPSNLYNLIGLNSLDLSNNQLNGSLSTNISNLRYLTNINLSYNQISGSIPINFRQFTKIETLNFSHNKLEGPILFSFEYLKALTDLNLSFNEFTGKLPPFLAKATNLQKIQFNNNLLEGCFPISYRDFCGIDCDFKNNLGLLEDSHFSSFCTTSINTCKDCATQDSLSLIALYRSTDGPNWQNTWDLSQPITTWYGITTNENGCVIGIDFDISQNLSGVIPLEIGNLYHLERLSLRGRNIVGSIPSTIGQLTNLVWLSISATSMSNSIPTEIGDLINLKNLNLYSNNFTGDLPKTLNKLPNLYTLSFGRNQLTGNLPEIIQIVKSPKLLSLNLENNHLVGEIPLTIQQLPSLKSLVLRGNQLTGIIPTELGKLSNLHTLDFSNNHLEGKLPSDLGHLPNLTWLHVSRNQLSGCFPESYQNICDINYDFTNNIGLPNTGDFNAFCTNEDAACKMNIWPGDFNNDGIANNVDMLYWGLACEGTRGPRRPNTSTDWEGQDGLDWQASAGEINNKHQDGNGDGIINTEDLDVLTKNYGLTHRFSTIQSPATDLAFDLVPLSYDTSTQEIRYELYLKEKEQSDNTHGVACTIDFGSLPIIATDFDFSNSFLAPDQQLVQFNQSTNALDLAFTRTDKKGQLNNAPLGILIIIVDNLIFDDPVLLSIQKGHKLSTNGILTSTDEQNTYTVFSKPNKKPTIKNHQPLLNTLSVYPNPIRQQAKIVFDLSKPSKVGIRLQASQGNKIITILEKKEYFAGIHEIDLDGLNYPKGVYFLSLITAEQIITKKMILLK